MNLYVGTSGFSYKEWKGLFYPAGLPEKGILHYYSEHFQVVEINNTFYRMPEASLLDAWAHEVSADFRFVLKAPQVITHVLRLRYAGDAVAHLFEVASTLRGRLGAVLFQLPPSLKKDAPLLGEFLALLPRHCRSAFEFRHQSWFDEEVFGLLRDHRAALCVADAETNLEIPFVATADWGYLRLRRPDYDDAELKAWAERVRGQDWRDAFVFFKHPDDGGQGPRAAERFLALAAKDV